MAKGVKTGGRQKGSLNKTTKSVKDALLTAFKQVGGQRAFTNWAKANPGVFYPLMMKLLPAEISIQGEIEVHDPLNTLEVAKRIAFILASAGQPALEAERVEFLPRPKSDPEPVEIVSNPVEAQANAGAPEPSVDISTYEGAVAEQGRSSRFSQHPRFMPRPVVRRRD